MSYEELNECPLCGALNQLSISFNTESRGVPVIRDGKMTISIDSIEHESISNKKISCGSCKFSLGAEFSLPNSDDYQALSAYDKLREYGLEEMVDRSEID